MIDWLDIHVSGGDWLIDCLLNRYKWRRLIDWLIDYWLDISGGDWLIVYWLDISGGDWLIDCLLDISGGDWLIDCLLDISGGDWLFIRGQILHGYSGWEQVQQNLKNIQKWVKNGTMREANSDCHRQR